MKKISAERMLPIREEVYQRIRKAIMNGEYRPGEHLHEEQLATQLGTSRTPVREALRKLEVEKLVIHHPHRGTVVSELSLDEIEELYEIRTLIEAFIAKRAAQNATPEDVVRLKKLLDDEEQTTERDTTMDAIDAYNKAVMEIANCPSIADLNFKVREILSRMIISGHLHPNRRAIAQKEHRDIVGAIANNDSDLAQRLTIIHLRNASRVLKPSLNPTEPQDASDRADR